MYDEQGIMDAPYGFTGTICNTAERVRVSSSKRRTLWFGDRGESILD